jgi:gamma-aminobutyric acid type B receptor
LDTPPDLPELEVDKNYIPKGLRVFSISMGAFIMLVSVGFACWTQVHSDHRVVKASQPIFLHIICIGTFLMGASIIPLTVDDQFSTEEGCDIACQIFPWLLLNGFVIAFSALFTKTHRINKIMKSPSCKKIKVTPFDVMAPMLFFVLSKSHFSSQRIPRQVFGDTASRPHFCH